MRRLASAVPLAVLVSGCAASPPANWAKGGALLDIPRARWVIGEITVDIAPTGKVFLNGEPELTVDRGGRVYDPEAAPVALLEPDGKLVGPNDAPLGVVGALHASLAGEANAWLTVTGSGEVIRYGDEGERTSFGVWLGCNTTWRAHQTCTLVSHIVGLRIRDYEKQRAMDSSMIPSSNLVPNVPYR